MKRLLYTLLAVFAVPTLVLAVLFHEHPALFTFGTIEVGAIAVVLNIFVILYLRRNWRANPYGRALMYTVISLAALSDLSLVTSLLGPEWEWRALVRALLFAGILVAHTRLLWLLFRTKNDALPRKTKEAS